MHSGSEDVLWASLPEELTKKIAQHAFDAWTDNTGRYDTLERDGWAMAHLSRAFFHTFFPMRLMLRHGPKHPHRAFCLVEGVLRYLHSKPPFAMPTCIYCLIHCEVYKSCGGCHCGTYRRSDDGSHRYARAWKTINQQCSQKNLMHALTYWLIHLYANGDLPKPTRFQRGIIVNTLGSTFHYVNRYHIDHLNLPSVRQHVEQAYAVVDALC